VPLLTTALLPVPLAPEISLYLADAQVGLFDLTDGEFRSDEPPPFWAFVWAGGQALARYVLDHPDEVRGRTVLDVAAGSGVAAIAAARAGASAVTAIDLDRNAAEAIRRNAAANDVTVTAAAMDVTESPATDVLLAGDVFYSRPVADRLLPALRRSGARVLVSDADRGFLPRRLFEELTSFEVPVRPALETERVMRTRVWQLRPERRPEPR
jgi:predicted nicotinamide N-methyase